jgi:membrane fusion protein (multidrug efflux system)
LQTIYANRAALGLPIKPPEGQELGDVPEDLPQTYSQVREALAAVMQSAARFGYTSPAGWQATPKEVIEAFYKQDPKGDFNTIIAKLIPKAPAIQQAQARLQQARDDLRQAKLNLLYCDIVSDIDGVVTRRNVNPGNYVQVGQQLMAVRSLTEIWIDANFKETELRDLRIGQRVVCEVDMYGSRREYEGRITGFTMGTGQTLALLPPQNATGNFVKIVQRLTVRIELTDYDPDEDTLFFGLSVEPCVYYREKLDMTIKNAGKRLQDATPLPSVEPYPKVK